jgi:hypothetical protein
METHGWNAAAEIPMIGELAAHVGSMVPARLHLVERRKVIQTKKGPQTSRFVVPVVDLEIKVRDLAQIVSGSEAPRQIEGGTQAAIEGRDPAQEAYEIYADQIQACQTRAEVNNLWRHIVSQEHLYPAVKAALVARGQALPPDTQPEEPARSPAQDGPSPDTAEPQADPATGEVVDGEVVADDDPVEADRAWQEVLSAAGKQGMQTGELMAEFESWAGHGPDQGTAAQFRSFIREVLTS